jgi:hypothetical protein
MAPVEAARDFKLAVARYRLSHGDPLVVISAAADLVGEGLGGPYLIDLAGSNKLDVTEFEEQVDRSLEELGIRETTRTDYGYWLTQEVARQIVQNEIEAVEGALLIKRTVALTVREDGPWNSFAGLVDEWEETTHEKIGYVDDITALARSVVEADK